MKVALVGAGRMGGAMVRGWAETGLAYDVHVFEPNPGIELSGLIGASGWQLNPEPPVAGTMDLVIVAVKPQAFKDACSETLSLLCTPETLVVSIMAGTTMATISEGTNAQRVVRAMPNTPGQIGQGITACALGPGVDEADRQHVIDLLTPLGEVVWLGSEKEIDLATAVSGSGPAYLFLMAESMIAAAEGVGLAPDVASKLVLQTLTGSAALMAQTGEAPIDLRRAVTSPGGTTAAAIDALTAGGGLHVLMRSAIEAAVERARQLSRA
jgi:pyrroline-5-carboxylate reductase